LSRENKQKKPVPKTPHRVQKNLVYALKFFKFHQNTALSSVSSYIVTKGSEKSASSIFRTEITADNQINHLYLSNSHYSGTCYVQKYVKKCINSLKQHFSKFCTVSFFVKRTDSKTESAFLIGQ